MDKNEIYEMLTAIKEPKGIAIWLREKYFPELMMRFNAEESRKRFGLYQNEQIPMNERNLTDVRTRMGILVEFELARISNELLLEMGIDDIFWSYVVANRFPDLEIRNSKGERRLRFEIKCLQCVAEEKSANFDTLKKDIDPSTDYVVVCLWDWAKIPSKSYHWDAIPMIFKVYVFHAYSLAQLRDTYWLNNPPVNLGDGYQGFDVRYAVTCANGKYSKEQGNYGKLTRIWKGDFKFRPVETDVLLDTEQEYLTFQKEIIFMGFEILAHAQLQVLSVEENKIAEVFKGGSIIGYKSGSVMYILLSKINGRLVQRILKNIASENNCSTVVAMTDKYRSTIYKITDTSIMLVAGNEKPKSIYSILNPS